MRNLFKTECKVYNCLITIFLVGDSKILEECIGYLINNIKICV